MVPDPKLYAVAQWESVLLHDADFQTFCGHNTGHANVAIFHLTRATVLVPIVTALRQTIGLGENTW